MGTIPRVDELTELVGEVGARRRKYIIAAADELAAAIRADADHLGTRAVAPDNRANLVVLADLPPQTFNQSRLWRYQLAAAADSLAADARTVGAPLPRCTGEEMILHLVLRRAAELSGCPPGRVHDWPDDPARADGWGDLFEYLFQDHDVLMLYDAARDDMADLGVVNIAPSQWFTTLPLPFPVPDRSPGDSGAGHVIPTTGSP